MASNDVDSVPGTFAPALRELGMQLRKLGAHRSIQIGGILFGAIVLVAIFADLIAPFDPNENNYRAMLAAPGDAHLLGTDAFGRDILSRVIHGTRLSLVVGIIVVIATGVLGTIIGVLTGYVRWLDSPLMRVMDGLMAFPGVLLAIALAAALGPSVVNAAIALTITFMPRTARIVRGSVLVVREMPYVEAARACGAHDRRIVLRHILPNAMPPLIVQLTFVFSVAILAEAVLSFMGVGPPPPTPSLGNIIAEGRSYIREAPWIALAPGVAIAISVLGLNIIGDGLRDSLDPRLRNL
ncbi:MULTISPECIES: ABC transporter permease [unclassified Roseitalea]|uniref:ABC transporter permease n=1 Tax=unclassified Roseitalea TaxID=2639107 RepID=UPI0027400013|nr:MULTISPECIES: ABC transporter permease [unclassified Roseitalea]